MRQFTIGATLAAAVVLGSTAVADAQSVVGTRGPGVPGVYSLGYYSPYPGTVYSPFARAPVTPAAAYGGYQRQAFYDPYYVGPSTDVNGFTTGYAYTPRVYTTPPGGVNRGRSFYPR